MFSKFFIERPVFAWVISIVVVLLGAIALLSLPIARYPEIAPPTVNVSASYPGANAVTVAETIAAPIEQQVNGVEGMLYQSSTSSSDGTMGLTVTFETGTDLDDAAVQVQNRVAVAEPRLPEEARRLGVSVKKASAEITLLIALTSPDGSRDMVSLGDYALQNVRDELARVPGVGDTQVFAFPRAMRVWLDPPKLQKLGLTAGDVIAAIREQNVEVAAGAIGAPPAPADQPFQFTVTAKGRLTEAAEFADVIVRTSEDNRVVRLRDVVTDDVTTPGLEGVQLGAEGYNISSTLNGQPCAAIAIYQLPGANALEVADGVLGKMQELKAGFPQGVDYEIVLDTTDVIRASIKEVVITLFITLVLVVLTVYVFLQNFRATLIPALTIPVSLVGTFIVLAALGFTLNTLTLFGLVLVIGIVVDDAIVVVENTTRLIEEEGLAPRAAAIQSMQEVTGPVIATTLVLLAVFVPTIFLGGILGQLFQQFAVTISIATVFSSINALTLSPMLCGALLRKSSKRPLAPFRLFNAVLDRTTTGYVGASRGLLRFAAVGVVAFVAIAVLAVFGLGRLPSSFVPQEDEGYFIVSAQLPDAASFARTEAVTGEIAGMCRGVEGAEYVLAIPGFSLLDGARTSNAATVFVVMEHWDDRDTSLRAAVRGVAPRLAAMQDAVAIPVIPPSLPGVGSSGGLSMQIQDRRGAGLDALSDAANLFTAEANAQTGLERVFTTYRAGVPQLRLDIDRVQAKNLGVRLDDVWTSLSAYLGSAYVNDFVRFGRINQVKVQAAPGYRATPDDIRDVEVRNRDGRMVRLGTFVTVEETVGPQVVTHFNIYPSALFNASPGPGFTSGEAMDIAAATADEVLPEGFGYAWTALSFQEAAAAGGSAFIFLLSAVLVYLTLAAQYESWAIPIGVIAAIPAALLGAVAGLFLLGLDNNAYTQIGIVLLIGLSAKTAILIVEFAKQRREQGAGIREAALDAARLRFRAVLMTAFSFILGVLPLVAATGAGASSRKILGITVLSGMLVGTVLSLLCVPMLYFVVQHATEKLRKDTGGDAAPTEPAAPTPAT